MKILVEGCFVFTSLQFDLRKKIFPTFQEKYAVMGSELHICE